MRRCCHESSQRQEDMRIRNLTPFALYRTAGRYHVRDEVIADHRRIRYTSVSMILEKSHAEGRDALPLRRNTEHDNG